MKTSLRTVLKNFLLHVEDLEDRKKSSDDQYEAEFQELKKLTDQLREDVEYSCTIGWKDVNRPKNRYKDIVPYDISRVVLPKFDGIPGSDYINASHVKGSTGALAYIAAQGPLPNTVIDFWRMIWMCDVQVIVMACNEQESGKNKCERYWPQKGEIVNFGKISVELINSSQVCPDFLVRTLLIKCDTEMRDVYQFHYTTWPDHGVPETVQPILELVRLMRDCQASETVPILLHCSAGCGRTGTICAVDFVWTCLRHGKLDKDFSLFQIALELRRQRIAMIQTKEQYILAHKVVAYMFEQQLKVIDCHIYENIDEDGEPLMWKELQKNMQRDVNTEKMLTKHCNNNNTSMFSSLNDNEGQDEANVKKESICLEKSPISDSGNKICESSSTINSIPYEVSSRNSVISFKNSDGSYSRNSYLSQQGNDDSIPFIDEDEDEVISVRPQCGRAYLNIPSCDSISKLINAFDPFVDKLSVGTDDSSPEAEGIPVSGAQKHSLCGDTNNSIFSQASGEGRFASYKKIDPDAELHETSDKMGEEPKNLKKVGKATVVRRPSISKLKALFERPSSSEERNSIGEVKRLLFRNHTHHVSRAGSAPPSLNCMDRNAAMEKESVLMMVTRKFRSSSVKSAQELKSKQKENPPSKKSAKSSIASFKESINSLSRTMSLNLNKTFKASSPHKSESEVNQVSYNKHKENVSVSSRFKLPDLAPKGKSMWYDKSSLPRAVAIVKPTESKPGETVRTPGKSYSSIFNVIDRPPKLLPFSTGSNKGESRDSSTMWYNTTKEAPKDTAVDQGVYAYMSKTLPTTHTSVKQKKEKSHSASECPVSQDTSKTALETSNSKFYTNVVDNSSIPPNLPSKKNAPNNPGTCPVPDEIIPISSVLKKDPESTNSFWPSSSLMNADSAKNKLPSVTETSDNSTPVEVISTPLSKVKPSEETIIKKPLDQPPAIPKKVGKGRGNESQLVGIEEKPKLIISESSILASNSSQPNKQSPTKTPSPRGNGVSLQDTLKDLYSNVNVTAKKNIEQIESAIRSNPRGAIIDLTSRQSYSMEEELVNAVEQLTAENSNSNPASPKPKPKTGKFPGYEVIWPESNYDNQLMTTNARVNSISKQSKTGLCYSPPLRRNTNVSFPVTKSQSCLNLDWMELSKDSPSMNNSFEKNSEPTKKLVNEAAVELNTLLNQLTTRTLTEEAGSVAKSEAGDATTVLNPDYKASKIKEPVPVSTKSYIAVATSKDEEIIFRFPPPPPVPPPPQDEDTSESFEIICKNGALLVANTKPKCECSVSDASVVTETPLNLKLSASSTERENTSHSPKPIPRKTKHSDGIQRSTSYTSIPQSESKIVHYENLFNEKYQTLSQLEGNGDRFVQMSQSLHTGLEEKKEDKTFEYKAKYALPKKPSKYKHAEQPHYANLDKSMLSYFKLSSPASKRDDILKTSKSNRLDTASELKNASSEKTEEYVKNMISNFPMFPDSSKIQGNAKEDKPFPHKFVVSDDNSNYGKIIKIADSRNGAKDNPSPESEYSLQSDHLKRKPLPSKKSERAPLPPASKSNELNDGGYAKLNIKSDPSLRKPPSRKQEKAPPPPPLLPLQKSSSRTVPLSKFDQNQYANVPVPASSKKLPALYENISDVQNSDKPVIKPHADPFSQQKTTSYGLQHSQSDVSVFRSIKERKLQYQGIPVKTFVKPLSISKKDDKVLNSGNDSDSSYEHIFPTKLAPKKIVHPLRAEDKLNSDSNEYAVSNNSNPVLETVSPPSAGLSKQLDSLLPKEQFKKTMPTAPPRSRRRSTTEISYAKVKSKGGSLISSAAAIFKPRGPENPSNSSSANGDHPPTIPTKTKDAFEIPEGFVPKGHRTKPDFQGIDSSKSHNAAKLLHDFDGS